MDRLKGANLTDASDMRLLAFLKVRHARTSLRRLGYVFGTDFEEDSGLSERMYQLYALIITAIGIAALWIYLLDSIEKGFVALGAEPATLLVRMAMIIPCLVFAGESFRLTYPSAIRLSYPDIAFIGNSRIATRPILALELLMKVVPLAVLGAIAGFAFGAGCSAVGVADAATMAMAAAIAVAAAGLAAWIPGIVRLAFGWTRLLTTAGAIVASIAGISVAVLAQASGLISVDDIGYCCMGGIVLAAAAALALSAAGGRIDVSRVMQESSLCAEMASAKPLFWSNSMEARDRQRRIRVSRHRPILSLPHSMGTLALMGRAGLSIVRQYEGIPSYVIYSMGIVPMGVYAISNAGGFTMVIAWAAMIVGLLHAPRELGSPFRSDMQNRMTRTMIPYDVLQILLIDTAPAFIVTSIISIAIVSIAAPFAGFGAIDILMAVLLNAAFALICGFDAIELIRGKLRLSYEAGVLLLVICVAIMALGTNAMTRAATLAGFCLAAALILRSSWEKN